MKKIILLIIIFLSISNIYTGEINLAIIYNLGVTAYREGKYDDALQKFRLVHRVKQDDFYSVYNIGNCYYKKNDFHEAVSWYVKARKLKPFDVDNLYNLSLAFIKLNRFEEAKKSVNALLTIKKDDAKYHFIFATIYSRQGDYGNAIKHYQEGITLNSATQDLIRYGNEMLFLLHLIRREYGIALSFANILLPNMSNNAFFNFNLANIYRNLGNFEQAEAKYKEAIKINPEFKEAYINLLYIYNLTQKWEVLDNASKDAIKKFPREFYFYVSSALALYRQKKYKESLAAMKAAIEIENKAVAAVEFVAHLELILDNPGESIKQYERVLIHEPNKTAVLVNLAYLYAKTNDLVKGVLTIHLGLRNNSDPIVYRYLAQLYLKARDSKNAYQCYVHYLKKYPKGDYITFYNIAKIYESQNNINLAVEFYGKSIRENYLFFNSHFNIGLLYENMQKYDLAINHYILCTNIYSENFEPFFRIFYIYTIKEEYNIALEYLEKAIKSGFRNVERIKENYKYTAFKNMAKFQEIMKKNFPNVEL